MSNGIGRLSGMQDESGKTSWSYDTRGNISAETRTIGGATFDILYTWDANGNLASIIYPSGREIDYVCDSVNVDRVSAVFSGTTLLDRYYGLDPTGHISCNLSLVMEKVLRGPSVPQRGDSLASSLKKESASQRS